MITGCLRVSKESIFTGLNNLEIISILNENYARYFGFTQPEVEEMLYYYGISEKKEELKRWYDGYLFGNTVYLKLAIPNEEVRYIYQNTIQEWFKKSVRSKDLSSLEDYEILSNRESGNGRPDILLKPYDEKKPAVILELKYAEKFTQMV